MRFAPSEGIANLPLVYGGSGCRGCIRAQPEDFQVDEVSLVEADGGGEHVLLWIEKRNTNTEWVATQLARHASVPLRDVSFAGMKDRHALTRQWFSVRLAGRQAPDWRQLTSDDFRVIHSAPHSRKLRRGALKGNRFKIRVRDLQGDVQRLDEQLSLIADGGIANYFGTQRFGIAGGNLEGAAALFRTGKRKIPGRKRGIYLSAARSALFNRVLAWRVSAGNWNKPLSGDRMMLDGSRNSFLAEQIDHEILRRAEALEIHPSGPLWGRGDNLVSGDVAQLEREALSGTEEFQAGLEGAGLIQERRALRARVGDLEWSIAGGQLEVQCYLPKGSFATVLLAEIIDYLPS